VDIKLYTDKNIHSLDWNDFPNGKEIGSYLLPLIKDGTTPYIKNSNSTVMVIATKANLIPIVVSSQQKHSSKTTYITSPINQFTHFIVAEINKGLIKNFLLSFLLKKFLFVLKNLYAFSKMDDIVYVNHWLFSTNLFPEIKRGELQVIIDKIQVAFPKKAIMFKSLNKSSNLDLIEYLKSHSSSQIAVRQIFQFNPKTSEYRKKRPYIMDRKLFEKSKNLIWEEIKEANSEDVELIQKLYQKLYIEKHNPLNPIYSKAYIKMVIESPFVKLFIVRLKKEIVGLTLFFQYNKILTTPLIGYNQTLPKKAGIYRLLNYFLMHYAIEQNLFLNMSSGAGQFKKQRGGIADIDYQFTVHNHLGFFRRISWKFISKISIKLAKPYFENNII